MTTAIVCFTGNLHIFENCAMILVLLISTSSNSFVPSKSISIVPYQKSDWQVVLFLMLFHNFCYIMTVILTIFLVDITSSNPVFTSTWQLFYGAHTSCTAIAQTHDTQIETLVLDRTNCTDGLWMAGSSFCYLFASAQSGTQADLWNFLRYYWLLGLVHSGKRIQCATSVDMKTRL